MTAKATMDYLTEQDFDTVARLGGEIWRRHFLGMITAEQIEYMLASRYVPEKLSLYLHAPDRWFRLLRMDGEPSGYFSYALAKRPGEMKLEQLYLLERLRGQGWGGKMMDEAERAARALGCDTLMLTVNRHNAAAIAVYQKRGFEVRGEVAADIGNGFVMDDFVMQLAL
ncbi:GNAT family N-acetyltransferase [Chromobacterium sp. IIBBL 290-4]|uniref:GNAT family N-acetyltransferase n=1 Tax=Chromobacterium sp. IIBBL 290-4 TaxID=2953890 RepID=UPI0020B6BE3A|nr:GNAT family N-acetyltransferase [Chromobacterium sp. IIBBL 290-4]UTH72898.1 GNAT family N-acetyltransferase [Chromobacterium sp. IIBBL 290-4]